MSDAAKRIAAIACNRFVTCKNIYLSDDAVFRQRGLLELAELFDAELAAERQAAEGMRDFLFAASGPGGWLQVNPDVLRLIAAYERARKGER